MEFRLIKASEVQKTCASSVLALALSVLFSWFIQKGPSSVGWLFQVPMNPMTAMGFVLGATSLLLKGKPTSVWRNGIADLLAIILCVIGFFGFIQHFGMDIHLDQVFFHDKIGTNRIAPNAALEHLATGLALLSLGREEGWRFLPSEILALQIAAVSISALVGHLYGSLALYGVKDAVPMAIHTGICEATLAVGLLFSHPDRGLVSVFTRGDMGSRIARRLFFPVLLIPVGFGCLRQLGTAGGWFDSEVGTSYLVVGTVFFLMGILWLCARSIGKVDVQLRKVLTDYNEELQSEINERVKQLKLSENQIRQLQKMDAVGRLAGGMAHDFNNLLGALKMYCDLITEHAEDATAVRANVNDVREVADRGAALTRQLLIFSRKQIVEMRPIDLNDTVQTLHKLLARLIGENIRVELDLAPKAGPVRADPGQIEQVLMNLVINARDAIDPEDKTGKITITTRAVMLDEGFTSTHLSALPGPHVLLSVTDNGSGMDEATRARLFEPFFTTKPVGKGTGLGLTTVYGIIKQCEASIWVYSEPLKGTTFKIYFPLVEGTSLGHEISQGGGRKGTSGPEKGQQKLILLAEDDLRLRKLYASALESKGYKVLAAKSGKEALEIYEIRAEGIDLVLTDVVMPELGGVQLVEAIRTMNPSARVLFMSGYADHFPDRLKGEAFIQKPFDSAALLEKISEVLTSPRT